jgi:hypothetical protein
LKPCRETAAPYDQGGRFVVVVERLWATESSWTSLQLALQPASEQLERSKAWEHALTALITSSPAVGTAITQVGKAEDRTATSLNAVLYLSTTLPIRRSRQLFRKRLAKCLTAEAHYITYAA